MCVFYPSPLSGPNNLKVLAAGFETMLTFTSGFMHETMLELWGPLVSARSILCVRVDVELWGPLVSARLILCVRIDVELWGPLVSARLTLCAQNNA